MIYAARPPKDRTQLEKDMQEYLENGGEITQIPSIDWRAKAERLIKRSLFYSAHHKFHSERTGISLARLKVLQRTPSRATDKEIEKLWTHFKSREWALYDYN